MAKMAKTSNFKLPFFVKYVYSKSFSHLGNTTALIFNKTIKMFMPHHGLKESQKVMLKSLIFGHPGTLSNCIEKNNFRVLVVVSFYLL